MAIKKRKKDKWNMTQYQNHFLRSINTPVTPVEDNYTDLVKLILISSLANYKQSNDY